MTDNKLYYLFAIFGMLLGVLSHLVTFYSNSTEAGFGIAILLLISSKFLLEKKEGRRYTWKDLMRQGLFNTILLWFVVWTILYNVFLVKP